MRRGVTPVIATVLLLMIGVAIAGGVFYWVTNMQGRIQSSVGSQAAQTGTKLTSNVVMVGLIINAFESNITATIHNIGEVPVIAGPASFTVSDRNNLVVRSLVTNLSVNVNQNEFATLSVNVSGSLIVDEVYVVKITFANGLMVTADSVARSFVSQTCASAIECNDGNVCSLDDCVNYVCSFINVPNGPVTGCTGGTGCGVPPCGCAGGSCVTYCTLDGECDDSNACTLDSCSLNSCAHSGLNGQVAGCNTGTNACVSGSCVDTCGNAVCNSGWEDYVNCIIDCPVVCQDVQGDCTGVYFTGTIVTENQNVCACCGDDAFENFYNGTLATTSNICYYSVYYDTGVDGNPDICDYYGYNWINNLLYPSRPYNFNLSNPISYSISFTYSSDIISDDFNGDNKLDVVATHYYGNISYLSGNGNGTFSTNSTFSNAPKTSDAITGDFNNDNKIDIITSHEEINQISYLQGNGDGTFAQNTSFSITSPRYIDKADFNEDTDLDLIILGATGFTFYSGNGDGTFTSGASYPSLNPLYGLTINDFNGDNNLDIVVTSNDYSVGTVKFYSGNGDGTFTSGASYSVNDVRDIVSGDFNNDGELDLVFICYNTFSDNFYFYSGNGDGTFTYEDSFFSALWPIRLMNADFNGDNNLDVIFYGSSGSNILYYEGDGMGGFTLGLTKSVGVSSLEDLTVGDFNRDNDIDIVSLAAYNYPLMKYYDNLGITSDMGTCCGDDGTSDNFYNGTLNDFTNYCINGVNKIDSVDSSKTLCEGYGYDWLSNINSVVSFSGDAEGSFPSGLSVNELFGDNPNVTEKVVDYYQGRYKVLEISLNNTSYSFELLNVGELPVFTSGNASLDFWVNIPRFTINPVVEETPELIIGLANLNEIFSDNSIMFGLRNDSGHVIRLRNGPGNDNNTYIGNWSVNTWINYRFDVNKDANNVKIYQDGVLLASKSYVSANPIDFFFIGVDRGVKDDKLYIDRLSFNGSNNRFSCCGDDVIESFDNRTSKCVNGVVSAYTSEWYSGCASGNDVVDWDGVAEFSRNDTLTCGCSLDYPIGFVNNGDFENDLTGWSPAEMGGSTVLINDTSGLVYDGDKSLQLIGAFTGTFQSFGAAIQEVQAASNVSFWINYSLTNPALAYAGLRYEIGEPFDGGNPTIYFLMNATGFPPEYCAEPYGHPNGNTYLVCMEGYPENVWNFVSVNPSEMYTTIFGGSDANLRKNIEFIAGEGMTAFFDNITVTKSPSNMYCDNGNNAGLADGLCYQSACTDVYLGSFMNTEFLNNEDILVNVSLTNFTAVTCSLKFNGTNYGSMTVSNGYASKLITTQYPTGSYLTNVTCTGTDTVSKTAIFTTNFIAELNEVLFNDLESGSYAYPVIGEFNASNPGKEIAYAFNNRSMGSQVSLLVLSSNLNVLNNYSYHDSESYINFMPLRFADTDNDGLNELLFIRQAGPNSNSTLFDNDFSIQYSTTSIQDVNSGSVAIADVSFTSGLEIITTSCGMLPIFYNTLVSGGTYNPGGSCNNQRSIDKYGPAVDDVRPGGIPEIVYYSVASGRLHTVNITAGINQSIILAFENVSKPSIAEFNSSFDGKEIVFFGNNTLYAFNSTLDIIWSYTFSGYSAMIPGSLVIGDVNGNSQPEIIVHYEVPYEVDGRYPRKLTIFDKYGTKLITDIDTEQGGSLALSELYNDNPGLEILMMSSSNYLQIINSTGGILYQDSGYSPAYLTEDINNDGYIEVVTATQYGIKTYKTSSTSSNVWPTFAQNNNNTGYLG